MLKVSERTLVSPVNIPLAHAREVAAKNRGGGESWCNEQGAHSAYLANKGLSLGARDCDISKIEPIKRV